MARLAREVKRKACLLFHPVSSLCISNAVYSVFTELLAHGLLQLQLLLLKSVSVDLQHLFGLHRNVLIGGNSAQMGRHCKSATVFGSASHLTQ